MDKKKIHNKSPRQGHSRYGDPDIQAQHMALAQQLGIPPEYLDPNMMAFASGMLPSGIDPQQLMNPMAAAYPFMNPSALQAFSGLGPLGGQNASGMHAASEWWNLAQNQALAASLGAGYYPGLMPPGFPVMDMKQKPKSSSNDAKNSKDSIQGGRKKPDQHSNSIPSPNLSQMPGTSGTNGNLQQNTRKNTNDSQKSAAKDGADGRHNHPTSSAMYIKPNESSASWMEGLNGQHNQKLNEQAMQAELMRQLEQQILVQQLHQQQQDHITAALQSVMSASMPGTSNSHKKASSDKMQDQLASTFQQMLQGRGLPVSSSSLEAMSPAVASLFSTPGAMEAMLAMTQMGNASAAIDTHSSKREGAYRDKKSLPPSLNHSSTSRSISNTEKKLQKISPVTSKNRTHSSPQKTSKMQSDFASIVSSLPPLPGFAAASLSPDTALLAAVYSQQLQQQHQYEALIKHEMEAVDRLRDNESKSSSKDESKSYSKYESRTSEYNNLDTAREFSSPTVHSRSNLYSPANSSSSRGRSHHSPHRDSPNSPSRKPRIQERSQSRCSGSSARHDSPKRSRGPTPKQDQSMSETLKLFSTLASNPNLSQQDLAVLLSQDPNLLLSSLNPAMAGVAPGAARLMDAAQNSGKTSPGELEKLNKELSSMLAYETQRLHEQLRQQQFEIEKALSTKKEGTSDNHISVIHQSNQFSNDRSSSSNLVSDRGKPERSELEDFKSRNGEVMSSDGDGHSENSADVSTTDGNYLPYGRKRRKVFTNEDELQEPLKQGWKREVRFKPVGTQFRGEVLYVSPTGRKIRTYPDVIKYLEENKVTHLCKNNFSFSFKLRVGSFYEQKDKESREWVKISESELDQHLRNLEGSNSQYRSGSPYVEISDQLSDKSEEKQRKRDDQERERQKDQLKLLRQQEKNQKMEQRRIEREIRERLAEEEKLKLEEARKLKYQEALRKAEELERQRIAEALERDQRRQHMLLMRALESRKRAEERERRREEIRVEKMMQREKKMEQRRVAMQIARELKMPVEDMTTIGGPELPKLSVLQGHYQSKCPHQLSGNATADILMVLEFIKTFKECLRIDDDIIPSLSEFQRGILNDPTCTPALVKITMTLLHQCLCDPGVPAPGPWLHCLTGVKVTDIDVSEDNYSEIMRLFIWARSCYKSEIAVRLESVPFLSLSSDEKAQSLAFLVNELVCSRPICMEIEKNLDTLATLRRDKWMVEGQMRQLRVQHERNFPGAEPLVIKVEDENSNTSTSSKQSSSKIPVAGGVEKVKEEPQEMTQESIFQKRMGELAQQHNSFNTQLANNSKPLRAVDLGQDRYKRRYWILPNLGGVYVEGLESGISYEDDEESPDESEEEEEGEKGIKMETEVERVKDDGVKEDANENVPSDDNTKSKESEKEDTQDEEKTNVSTNVSESEKSFEETGETLQETVADDSTAKDEGDGEPIHGALESKICNDICPDDKPQNTNHDNSVNALEPNLVVPKIAVNNSNTVTHTPSANNTASLPIAEEPSEDLPSISSASTGMDVKKDENPTSFMDCEPVVNISDPKYAVDNNLQDQTEGGRNSPSLVEGDKSETSGNSSPHSADTEKLSGRNEGFHLLDSGKAEDDMVSLATKGALRTLQDQDDNKTSDSVEAAAKAIAMKAVASSTHLLFGKNESPKLSNAQANIKSKHSSSDSDAKTLPFGTLTINALVEMGVNPTSLTSQQLEALSHLELPMKNKDCIDLNQKDGLIKDSTEPETILVNLEDHQSKEEEDKKVDENEESLKTKKLSSDQDGPMDLSCPVSADQARTPKTDGRGAKGTSSSTPVDIFSNIKTVPIKQEPDTMGGSSFLPIQDDPNSKNNQCEKLFLPITPFTNNGKVVPMFGDQQQHYKQIISACPSPNTLANFIVSSANYSQFPGLENIKFPIRAPDVKGEPDTIPREMKRGWWRVGSEPELRALSEKLHMRGIREKNLHRNITKNFELCTNSMSEAATPEHTFATFHRKEEEVAGKVKEEIEKTETEDIKAENGVVPDFGTSDRSAFESEMKVLHRVEELAEKCCDMDVVSTQWRTDNPNPSICRLDLIHVPLGSLRDERGLEIKFDITSPIVHDPRSSLGAAVELLGRLERAVCRRYLKPPLVRKGGATEFSSLPSLSESGAMDVAAGLRTWRNAVASSSSAAQLALCVKLLENCIAWNKSVVNSPMKTESSPTCKTKKRKPEKRAGNKAVVNETEKEGQVKKKRKRKANLPKNAPEQTGPESKKTKRSRMPIDTADVISKSVPNSNDEIAAAESDGIVVNGDGIYDETNSENDTNPSFPPDNCFNECPEDSGTAQQNGEPTEISAPLAADYHTNSDNLSAEEYRPSSEVKKKKKKKKSKKAKPGSKSDEEKQNKGRKKTNKEIAMCKTILRELQSHEAATWFLFPVDCKVVPGYRKIIKRPIDFHTIESRLKKGKYKTTEDFVSDVRLVFDNCQKFNEDDSNIGRAGHELRRFFEIKWSDVCYNNCSENSAPTVANASPPSPVPLPEIARVSPVTPEVSETVEPEAELESQPEVEMDT